MTLGLHAEIPCDGSGNKKAGESGGNHGPAKAGTPNVRAGGNATKRNRAAGTIPGCPTVTHFHSVAESRALT